MNPLLALIVLEKKTKSAPVPARKPGKFWHFSENGEAARLWRQSAASFSKTSTTELSANGHKQRWEGQTNNVERGEVTALSRVGA